MARPRVSREIIDEIRSRNDIVDLIGNYVNLKRAGANFNGLCPFHTEKTGSFTVWPATQTFHCFGCGASGDAFTFVMRTENLDYMPAVEFLAKRAGITIETSEERNQGGISRQRIYDMNLAAAKYFRSCLFDPEVGHAGMEYFAKKRGLSPVIIKRFGLGFAPDGFGALTNHMHKLGFTDEELIVGFLCGKSQKTGRAYDYFRNRVIFPIINTSGDIIGFGGRVLDDSKPKYLNSSDTPGFNKSKNLFALNFAKNHCAERMILCEGYMDVIALHAAGFENAVATLGTALTMDQARLLAKRTKQVILSYDSDNAGQAATRRAVKMLTDVGLDVKILRMSGAKDPDEYIKKFGRDSFARLLDSSLSGFEFKLESTVGKYNLELAEDKIKASKEMCQYISEVSSGVEREVYIAAVAKKLSVSYEGLKNDVELLRRKLIKEIKAKTSQEARLSAMSVGDRINTDGIKNIKAKAAEEAVIGLMLLREEYRSAVVAKTVELSASDFVSEFHGRAFEKIIELQIEDQYDFAILGEFFNVDEMGRLHELEQKRLMLTENGPDVFKQCIEAVKKEKQLSDLSKGDGIDEIRRLLESKRGGNKNT